MECHTEGLPEEHADPGIEWSMSKRVLIHQQQDRSRMTCNYMKIYDWV